MGRCDRRCLAIGIKRSLSKIDKMIVKEAKKIEVDALMYEFARLHGIGVIPTIDEDLRTEYTFFNNPEAICNFDKMRMGFDSACVNIFWENVDSELLYRALGYVTEKLHLKDWRLYLKSSDTDWDPMRPSRILTKSTLHDDGIDAIRYSINSIIPRARMLNVSTNGPVREAVDRLMKTSQHVDVDSMYPKFSDNILNYMKKDVESTMDLYKRLEEKKNTIKKVIFHDPATIIYWEDGTKTVVKVQNGEKFDPEKGMAMAICKKTHGNDSSYYEAFKKFLPKEEKKTFEFGFDLPEGTMEPIDLEESTDAVTIDTEAEQYTGENPKEVSDNQTTINDALLHIVKGYSGYLNVTFIPDASHYRIEQRNCKNVEPYYVHVESPTEEISPTCWAQLKLDILKHFDISDAVTIDTGEAPKVRMCERAIDEELKEFAEVVGFRVIYDPINARYCISDNYPADKVYEYHVESPEKKLSCLEWAKLQHNIFEYFDI